MAPKTMGPGFDELTAKPFAFFQVFARMRQLWIRARDYENAFRESKR
jgi:hypothetical protein